jgi:hypothetical protein
MVARKKEVAVTEDQMPSYIKQGAARGNENVSNEDLQLPRIDVLQALSPQINKKKDEYIEGAEVGMIFNTLTGELYPDGLYFTPVQFTKRYLVWVDRKKDNGGGLRGIFDTEAEAQAFVNNADDGDKLEVVATAEHLVLLDSGDEVILSMAKSKQKVSRKFNSMVRLNGGDRFSRRYRLTSVDDDGPQGEYQNFAIANAGWPDENVYLKAEALYNQISEGSRPRATGDYSNEY